MFKAVTFFIIIFNNPILDETQIPASDAKSSSDQETSPTKRLDTPLASMLPPQYADKDVREWFPDFRPGEVSLHTKSA